jgi:hypothetical protein
MDAGSAYSWGGVPVELARMSALSAGLPAKIYSTSFVR